MAQGIKTIYATRKSIPQNLLRLVLNALVLTYLHIIKLSTYFRQKFESVQHIKRSRNLLPIKLFL